MEKDLTEIGGIGPRILIVVFSIAMMIGLFYTGIRLYAWGTNTVTGKMSAERQTDFIEFCSQDEPVNGAVLYEAILDFENRDMLTTVVYDTNRDMTPDPSSSSDTLYGPAYTYNLNSLLELIKSNGFDYTYYVTYATQSDGSNSNYVKDENGNILMGVIPYGR